MLGNSVSRPFIIKDLTAFAEALSKMNEDFQHLCDVRIHIVNATERKVRIETNQDWPETEEHGLEELMPEFEFFSWLAEHLQEGQCAVLETAYPRTPGYTDERLSPYWEVTVVSNDGMVMRQTSDEWVNMAVHALGGDIDLNNQT
jgi:hypothetical protein